MNKIVMLFSLLSVSVLFSQQEKYSRVKIWTDNEGLSKLSNLGIPVDHGVHKQNTFFISDFSTSQIEKIKSQGLKIEIEIDDVSAYYRERNNKIKEKSLTRNVDCPTSGGSTSTFDPNTPVNFNLGVMAGFFSYDEYLAEIDAMKQLYPNLITTKAPISNFLTHENRPVYWMRISDNASMDETNEPEVLYTAIHHAREPLALSQTIFYMWYLLENYNTNEEVKYLVDHTEMYFVPCLNPDGYNYNYQTNPDGGGMHRKNRRDVGSSNKGVDLNRNYSYGWGTTGISMNVDDDTYPGTGAFSEPETQAIKWFCENHDFIFASNAHTYSNLLLFPIGTTVDEFAPDHDYFQAYTNHMVEYNGFNAMKSSGLYPASGDSDDYMYKVDLNVKPQIFAMTPEVGSDSDGFWPSTDRIEPLCKDMVFTNLVMSHLSHKYVITKDTDPNLINSLSGDFHHSAYRLGNEDGSVEVSIQPLQGIQSVGNPVTYTLNKIETQNGVISYVLNPTIQFGDVIKYILKTDNGLWVKKDTITKTYGEITMQAFDDATTSANWTGNWSLTSSAYYSASKSFTESPTGNYQNNANKTYQFNQTVNLMDAASAQVSFYAKWDIENDFDMVQFQVSTDNGSTWISQCGKHTNLGTSANGSIQPDGEPLYDGLQSEWVLEEINLSEYLGQSLKLRFTFQSDQGATNDGFYFDDFKVSYNIDDSGLEFQNKDLNFSVFPNPSKGSFYLASNENLEEANIIIVDCSGKEVYRKYNSIPMKNMLIETNDLLQGIYQVYMEKEGTRSLPKRLVIVK